MGPLRHIKPSVRSIAAYTLAAREAAVKLNQNENPYDLPEAVKRRVLDQALARPWSRYPDFDPKDLVERLAAFSGWRPDGILAGNGSNELIEALLLVTVGPGTRVVIPEPTFTLYALLTKVLGGKALRVGLGPELEYQADELRRVRHELAAPLTIVCSPNNPTGGLLPAEEVARLCEDADGLVVVDEAYHEFSGQSVVPLLARHSNLVVLRTFSKAMGLAGLRIGYLLASPEIVREVNKARLPYNLNFFAQAAARAALDSVWPMLSDVSVEDVWRRMEDDAKSRLSEPDVTRWAIAGALRAALERLRTQWTDERRLTDATLHRQRLAGLVAFRALQFAKTAKALRHEPPTHPPRFRAT